MKLTLRKAEDVTKILEYFNYFHDSFIKLFIITSRDSFEKVSRTRNRKFTESILQNVTGKFDAEIHLAHHNYANGKVPLNQIIRAKFINVRDVLYDLSLRPGWYTDWTIDQLTIVPQKQNDTDKNKGPRFNLWIQRNFCENNTRWIPTTSNVLHFEMAEFEEVEEVSI